MTDINYTFGLFDFIPHLTFLSSAFASDTHPLLQDDIDSKISNGIIMIFIWDATAISPSSRKNHNSWVLLQQLHWQILNLLRSIPRGIPHWFVLKQDWLITCSRDSSECISHSFVWPFQPWHTNHDFESMNPLMIWDIMISRFHFMELFYNDFMMECY